MIRDTEKKLNEEEKKKGKLFHACALVTSGARNCESFSSSQISALVPSPLGNLAAASRTRKKEKRQKSYEWLCC